MSTPVITATNLSKRFYIGGMRSEGMRYMLERAMRNPLSLFQPPKRTEFWALDDLNFQINQGEMVAVMGRNGAGKSTLLKLISRITPPTRGTLGLRGRVGSLLEVGTGFHPELSGRENIFLNGAILGMKKAEIVRNLDAIVEFAEISKFLDTPVKRYSSGMFVRLAFAVAAHLQTEILIVDEVLAVGDSRFQKKCINKMNEVGRDGSTVLFVSHNIALVQSFCQRGLLLDGGKLVKDAPLPEVVELYQKQNAATGLDDSGWVDLSDINRSRGLEPILRSARVCDGEGLVSAEYAIGSDIELTLRTRFDKPLRHVVAVWRLQHPVAGTVSTLSSHQHLGRGLHDLHGEVALSTRFTLPALLPGNYTLSAELYADGTLIDEIPCVSELAIAGHDYFGTSMLPTAQDGVTLIKADWNID